MRIIIAGSRNFNDYDFLKSKIDFLISKINKAENITIVSGGANGADKLGERYAKENKLSLIICNANWDRFGKQAGYMRNLEMGSISDALVLLWDGQSKGSAMMKDIGNKLNLNVREYVYK